MEGEKTRLGTSLFLPFFFWISTIASIASLGYFLLCFSPSDAILPAFTSRMMVDFDLFSNLIRSLSS